MFKSFAALLSREFSDYSGQKLSKDVMSGITVAAVALPLALAFGVSSGSDAAAGLITAIIAGLVIGALSGASFQISGPTGAMSAVLVTIVARYGLQGVFIVGLMAGVLMLFAGIFKIGKLVGLIPMPVITGFTSGIAVIIALGQIDNFFGTTSKGSGAIEKIASYGHFGFSPDWQAVLIGVLVIAIMVVWPKKWNGKIPSSLIAIIGATIVSILLHLDVATVGKIPSTLFLDKRLDLTSVNWVGLSSYASSAITIAALGMIESLLCGASAARMKQGTFDADQELIAQGIGNILLPFFGGVPATAAIARTSVAIKSGSETRVTSVVHALVLLLSMFLLGPVMSHLPLSALAGVLIVTAFRMNEWHAIQYFFNRKFKAAILQFTITMTATVVFDLTVAIIVGVIVGVFGFLMRCIDIRITVSKVENQRLAKAGIVSAKLDYANKVIVYITGALFFANTANLIQVLNEQEAEEIILSFRGVTTIDSTATHTLIHQIASMERDGFIFRFSGVIKPVKTMLVRGGIYEVLNENRFYNSVDEAILQQDDSSMSGNTRFSPSPVRSS